MAVRPHETAGLKQLAALTKEQWSAPQKLAEILAELRLRDEPDAEPMIHSIARRLSLLNYRPPTGSGEAANPSAQGKQDERRRRRRLLLALLPAAAAAVAAAALLWPEKPTPVPPRAGGLDLAAHGASAPASPKAALSLPPRPPEQRRNPAREAAEPVAATPAVELRGRAESLRDAPGTPLHGSAAAMFVAALPPILEQDEPRRADAIGPNILNGRMRRPAEGGVYIGQARLRCYKTNDDPDACGRNLWGGNTRVGLIEPSRPVEEWRAATAEFRHPRPPDTAHPLLGATMTPGGIPPGAGEPRGPALPKDRTPPLYTEAPPNCPAPPIGRSVFILDGSLSMGLPLGVGAELEDRLDAGILNKEPEARRRYRELLAEPGPKRITRAREAFAAATKVLPSWVELGLVVFRECKDIRNVGVFQPEEREKAVTYIRSLIPRGRTPIADSLRAAATMLGDGPSSIVLLTDGREFCGGDPCAAAKEIHAKHPATPVSVIDISGQAKAECIADATGGRVYAPTATDDLGRVLHNAFRGADSRCPMYDGDNPPATAAKR